MILENNIYRIEVNDTTGVISSVFIKPWNEDLIKEKKLADNFKVSLPLPGRLDNYIYGKEQKVEVKRDSNDEIKVKASELRSFLGLFPVYFTYTIAIKKDEIHFQCHAENKCDYPLAEIWYPIIGGMYGIGERKNTVCVAPGYTRDLHPEIFQRFSRTGGLGNEDAIQILAYPGSLTMPWIDLFNKERDISLYIAEYNEICRAIHFVFQLTPGYHESTIGDNWPHREEVGFDIPLGITTSRVAMPHTKKGHTFNPGTFILKIHTGDWHKAAKIYRQWFPKFSFDKTNSWLRKEQAWFSSVIYQPEDRVIANYKKYTSWMKEAINMGITTGELIGWDKGGLERDYPEYVPEEKLGGKEGYKKMMKEIHKAGGHILTFVNYQILDSCTDWFKKELHKYRRMDSFGNTENWMQWGESNLKAIIGVDTRRHVPASPAIVQLRKILEDYFEEIARDGSNGLQIDKVEVNGGLDFNPSHHRDPDLPMCEDLIRGIEQVYRKCKAINPDFNIAAEANIDRFIPYVDVFYRAGSPNSISTLRYTFPEWTACVHCGNPFGYNQVNGALLFGMVLVVEPRHYTSPVSDPASKKLMAYIKECLRIRRKLFDRIFLADYLDDLDAEISPEDIKGIVYKVHVRYTDGKRTIVVVNYNSSPRKYNYRFTHKKVTRAKLYEPFKKVHIVPGSGKLEIPGERVHIITEE